MENLIKTSNPNIIETYKFREWTITIIEEFSPIYNEPVYEFYLTGLSITNYMFGIPKRNLFQSFEELIINNLEEHIVVFKKLFDECDEIENPFEDD